MTDEPEQVPDEETSDSGATAADAAAETAPDDARVAAEPEDSSPVADEAETPEPEAGAADAAASEVPAAAADDGSDGEGAPGPVAEEEPEADAEPEAEAAEEAPASKPRRRRRKAAEAEASADADAEEPEAPAKAPAPTRTTPSRRRGRRDPDLPAPVVRAQAKYVRSSARKARLVCDNIRGKSVDEARAILALTPRAIARDWSKLLESAIANAEHNHELVGEDLYVKAVHADEGPTIKRFRPRAMGRATRIRKRTSHLTILLTPKD
jgi:ribosomal protein L22